MPPVEFQDYYATLGIPKTASEKEIRTAYRKLARQHHPDVNPGKPEAEERFKQINEAYEVLSDAEKRRKYDQLGARWRDYESWERAQEAAGGSAEPFDFGGFAGQAPGGGTYEYRSVSSEDLEDLFGGGAPFSDFFETFFAGRGTAGGRRAATGGRATADGRRVRPARAGADLEHRVEIDLAEAYRGTTREIVLRLPDGSTRRLEVKIPPGVATGSRVRIAGQGHPGRDGGSAGDLYLVVDVTADHRFERRGADLITRARAPLEAFVLGGEARVATPDGRTLALTIPAGSHDGRSFRLRGQGMPVLGQPGRRGDLHAEVHVALPERLTARQRELIEEFSRAGAAASDRVGSRGDGAR